MLDAKVFANLRHWVEPAHPEIVKQHDDLVAIYNQIKQQWQPAINDAFDRVSRQIGFVVTTTLPAVFEAKADAKQIRCQLSGENLQGTIFETEFKKVLDKPISAKDVAPGTYRLYLLWTDALMLRLRTEWMEPAHIFQLAGLVTQPELQAARVRPETMEPVHWFDPGIALQIEERLVISAIDTVYPELKLVDRLTSIREFMRRPVGPGVKEPAHFRVPRFERE